MREQTVVGGKYLVSTVLLNDTAKAMDSFLGIFEAPEGRADLTTPGDYETMVFPCNPDGQVTDLGELDFARYSSEEDALTGHAEMVERWTTKTS